MPNLPDGISQPTFNYVLAFTVAHEGDTPFMYNNYPLKNSKLDVTVGVGRSLPNEDAAAADEIRRMFTVKATGSPATAEDMRAEYRRVAQIARTSRNLESAYRDASPLLMDREAMLESLSTVMLSFWASRGQVFEHFEQIPAQAQVALMSYNYGLRLSNARNMCDAVRRRDFVTAGIESRISGWDAKKNEAHMRLFENAAKIFVDLDRDNNELPPIEGPFKPPPAVEE